MFKSFVFKLWAARKLMVRIFLATLCIFLMLGLVADIISIKQSLALLDSKIGMVFHRVDNFYREVGSSILRDLELAKSQANFSKATVETLQEQVEQVAALDSKLDSLMESFSLLEKQVGKELLDAKLAEELKRLQQTRIELNIVQQVVYIVNESEGTMGSGTTIRHNNKYYIITAAHVVGYSDKNKIILKENGMTIGELKVVKLWNEVDLALMEPKDPDLVPKIYAELGTDEPVKSTKVYVCGNPTGLEDVLSEGRIITYSKHVMYIQDHCYFGSSGGGVFTMDGKFIGVISFMSIQDPNPAGIVTHRRPQFIVDGIIRLNVIREFLKDVK